MEKKSGNGCKTAGKRAGVLTTNVDERLKGPPHSNERDGGGVVAANSSTCVWMVCVYLCGGRPVCVPATEPHWWVGVMDGTWNLRSRSDKRRVSSHQTGGLDGCVSFSALVWVSFGGGSLTAAGFRVLFQRY